VDERAATIRRLAEGIDRAGLRAPAALILDLLSPVDVISSQLALLAHPFVRGTGLDPYARLLADSASWQELRRLLASL
jgi:hypothetical protein